MLRKGITEKETQKRIKNVQLAFPDAQVQNYQALIVGLELPDENDKHVLAAAIKTNANLIITENIKDFPEDYLLSFGLCAKRADDFCTDIIDLNPEKAKEAFITMVSYKRKPLLNEYELLDILRNQNLRSTADYLHSLI